MKSVPFQITAILVIGVVGFTLQFLFYSRPTITTSITSPNSRLSPENISASVHVQLTPKQNSRRSPENFSTSAHVQSTPKQNKKRDKILKAHDVNNVMIPSNNFKCKDSFKASHIMTLHDLNGRTGNHMFKLAMLLSTARRYCYTPMLKNSIHLDSIFDFSKSILKRSSNIPIKTFKQFTDPLGHAMTFNTAIGNISTHYNWSFVGYFQSWRYFFDQQAFIKTQFKFKPSALSNTMVILKKHNISDVRKISVHVRRRDMTLSSSTRFGYGTPNATYISRAMAYFRKRYDNFPMVFIFVSDDISWCKKNFKAADVIFSDAKSIGTDLALMSLSDDVIITSGSFGWMGAWLSGGHVVYYKGFPIKGTPLKRQFTEYDYYPAKWKGLW